MQIQWCVHTNPVRPWKFCGAFMQIMWVHANACVHANSVRPCKLPASLQILCVHANSMKNTCSRQNQLWENLMDLSWEICHESCVTKFSLNIFVVKMVELVNVGSVINWAYPVWFIYVYSLWIIYSFCSKTIQAITILINLSFWCEKGVLINRKDTRKYTTPNMQQIT